MRHGFSLVEVMVALGVFSVAVIGICSLLSSSAESSRSSANDTVLAALITSKVAELHACPFATLFSNYASGTAAKTEYREDGTVLSGSDSFSESLYECSVTKNQNTGVADSADALTATYLDLVIEFSWPRNSGYPKRIKIPIRIARYE